MFGDERIIKDWAEFVVGQYGDSQKVIAIEEMGELIQAVTKDMRGKTDLQNLSEEIGDVVLTLAQKSGQQVVVSYRAIGRLAKMLKLLSIEEALETCLVKGLEKDDRRG